MTAAERVARACEVCGHTGLDPVLDLGLHPLCDDLVPIGEQRVCAEYPVEILLCPVCLTAHQRHSVPKRELFPPTYHYRSRFTADVLDGMRGLAAAVEARLGGLAGRLVLDVGCNDGSLLGFFRERGARTLGVEPTDAYSDAVDAGHEVLADYFTPELAQRLLGSHGHPDVITFTNVFAHIEDLPTLLASLRVLLGEQTLLVIENHYLGSVLDGCQFDTFYHEHPRTYSARSFRFVAQSLGLALLDIGFPSRYGGNIRVTLGRGSIPAACTALELSLEQRESGFPAAFATMRASMENWRQRKSRWIRERVAESGPMRAKAFPGRAAILIRLLGLDVDAIEAVYEKSGSKKIGHYVPGTRIPILPDDELFASPNPKSPLLNLAWHISEEIRAHLRQHGYVAEVRDILSPEDLH
jgi:hypothetical protein